MPTGSAFQPVPLKERFWLHVNKTDTCWLWTGARKRNYGKVRVYKGRGNYAEMLAHRASWELANGPIPESMAICHHCDTPLCVRPDHLFIGTITDNHADMVAKGRQCRGEINGNAKLTAEMVLAIRDEPMDGWGDMTRWAKALNVSHATLSLIRSKKNWKHL